MREEGVKKMAGIEKGVKPEITPETKSWPKLEYLAGHPITVSHFSVISPCLFDIAYYPSLC